MEACMPRLPLLLLGLLLGWLTACATVGTRSNAQVAFEHGLSLFQRGQYAEAIPLFQEATQLDPDFGQAYLYLGRSYLNLGQWGNAIPVLRTAFRLAPEASKQEVTQLLLDALLGGATAALKTGGFREAVGLLKEALGLAPHAQHLLPPLVEALSGLGGQLLAQGQLRDAIGAFTEATQLAPQQVDAYVGLARAWWQQGELFKALAVVQDRAPPGAERQHHASPAAPVAGTLRHGVKNRTVANTWPMVGSASCDYISTSWLMMPSAALPQLRIRRFPEKLLLC
jgi:tetratricopeptide (TPR) repeat protein